MMRRTLLFCAALVAVCGFTFAGARAEGDQATARPIDALAWLVGGTWVAKTGSPTLQRVETTYTWSANHTFLRFVSRFVMADGPHNHYDGSFYYDPDARSLVMWNMDDQNKLAHGPLVTENDGFSISFSGHDDAGNPADYRIDLVRRGNDRFDWTALVKSNGTYAPFLTLTFDRTP